MSLKQNDVWLESKYENFMSALVEEQFDLARDILAEVRTNGFEVEATNMEKELATATRNDNELYQ